MTTAEVRLREARIDLRPRHRSPLISVVVPVFNRADVIWRAVGSLLRQQFDQPHEIVVVDDGSTDDSSDGLDALSPRVRVVRQAHLGAAAARRTGIEASRGKFIAFLDSDDVAEPWHLQEHWSTLCRRQGAVLSFAPIKDMAGAPVGRPTPVERLDLDSDNVIADPLTVLIREGCITGSMNLVTPREVALRAAAPQYDVPAACDYSFALHVALQGPFAYIDRTTIRVERRDDGIGRTRKAEQFGYNILAMFGALKASRRTDPGPLTSFRKRLADAWPSAVVAATTSGHWRLAARLAALGLRYGLRQDFPKRLWWAVSEVHDLHRHATIAPGR